MKYFFEVFFPSEMPKKFTWKNGAFIKILLNETKQTERSFLSYILYIPMA